MSLTHKDIVATLSALDLPATHYCVIGSGALAAHGIRDAQDIDLLVTTELFEQLKAGGAWQEIFNHRRKLQKDDVELMDTLEVGDYHPNIKDVIQSADVIDGIPFQPLADLVNFKRARGSQKDFNDIQLIEDYLAKK